MTPVFYIGSGCGEIHLKMDNGNSVNIKISSSSRHRYSVAPRFFTGLAEKVTVNGIEQPEFFNRRITYVLLAELYKLSTGETLKYGSIFSGRNNLKKVQELIKEMAPDLHINFKPMEQIGKIELDYSIDDQIFNAWVKNV